MRITLVQTELVWEAPAENISRLDARVRPLRGLTDLIVLPEMFTTGFTMRPDLHAEAAGGEGFRWMKKTAEETGAAVTGSIATAENGKYYNRLYWVEPDGKVRTYDKRHLFRMAGEEKVYEAGTERLIVEYKGWRICPLICYDLRFPAWSRNVFTRTDEHTCDAAYDLLIYVANWPEVRSYPWKQLLIARAIENQCFVAGVNRVGNDGNGYAHAGDSVLIDARGAVEYSAEAGKESAHTAEADLKKLQELRKTFPVGLDADEFWLKT